MKHSFSWLDRTDMKHSFSWLEDKYSLTPQEAAVVEWQYHLCGDFHKALWHLIALADEDNLTRLGKIFPFEVGGYRAYTQESGWWQEVEKALQTKGFSPKTPKNG